jgi:hypothetical protein
MSLRLTFRRCFAIRTVDANANPSSRIRNRGIHEKISRLDFFDVVDALSKSMPSHAI